jgi:flagellar hook-basal body complex protein FliE
VERLCVFGVAAKPQKGRQFPAYLGAAAAPHAANLPGIVITGIYAMETKGLDQILGQLRTAAAFAGGGVGKAAGIGNAAATGAAKGTDFANLLKSSLDQVNSMQQAAVQKSQNFELGAADTSLQDVMVSIQKASISFQQTVQVRNKLVSAYHDIMNMQV